MTAANGGINPQTLADQRAYLTAGLQPLSCDTCQASVRVKKNSALHVSVQWTVAAVRQCEELADHNGTVVTSCGRLRDSIDRAVGEGRLATTSRS